MLLPLFTPNAGAGPHGRPRQSPCFCVGPEDAPAGSCEVPCAARIQVGSPWLDLSPKLSKALSKSPQGAEEMKPKPQEK